MPFRAGSAPTRADCVADAMRDRPLGLQSALGQRRLRHLEKLPYGDADLGPVRHEHVHAFV